jgi:paired amphipathic helix protein Sin3a
LFRKEHVTEVVEQGDVITYRTRVAGIIDSMENTYHITFKVKSRSLGIKLLDGNNITSQTDEGCGGYDEYVSNYIDWANETKGINQDSLTPRFLQR